MTKNRRKANKDRKHNQHLNDIVKESYPGHKVDVGEMLKHAQKDMNMCGYLREPHYDNKSYYGYCAITKHDCTHRHIEYNNDCDAYNKRFNR